MSGKDAIRKHLEAIYGPLPPPNGGTAIDRDNRAPEDDHYGDIDNFADARSDGHAKSIILNDNRNSRCSHQTSDGSSTQTASPTSSRILKGAWTKAVPDSWN